MNKKTTSSRIIGYDEAKIKAAIRKAFLDAEFSYVEKIGDIEVSWDGLGIVIKPSHDSTKKQGSILSEAIVSVMKERGAEMQISDDGCDSMYCANTRVIDFPQMNCTATCAFFHRDASYEEGRKELDVDGYERRTSRSVFNFEDDVDVTNNIKKGKEHGSPRSPISMGVVDVPPKKEYWKKFRVMLLGLEFAYKNGKKLDKVSVEYHYRNQIEKDYDRLCIINDFQVIFSDGNFYLTQNDDGSQSLPIPKEDIDIDIASTILTEIDVEPGSRYPMENLFRVLNNDYKAMVKCILSGTFRNMKMLGVYDIEKLDYFRDKVIRFRKDIEVKD